MSRLMNQGKILEQLCGLVTRAKDDFVRHALCGLDIIQHHTVVARF